MPDYDELGENTLESTSESAIGLQPLDDDCRLLGNLLDVCLKHEIGETLFKKVA